MTTLAAEDRAHAFSGRFSWAGYLLGFALGGFFDGILLHQILQWHHLLSGVEGAPFRDLRVQVLADGLFHAIMYLIAGAGLWLVWRGRHEFTAPGADRLLFANVLIGFGVWHIVDSILSHWLLGIHRIRMDATNVLLWDLIWFFLFGVLFVAAGWLLRRRSGPGVGAVDGRVIWSDATGELWAIELGADGTSGPLYRHGALLVSSSILPIGCLPWLRA